MVANKEGTFAAPPPDAPREVSSPIIVRPSDQSIAAQREQAIARAAARGEAPPPAEELSLPAFAPKPMSDEAMATMLGKSIEEIRAMRVTAGAAVAPGTTVTPPPAVVALMPEGPAVITSSYKPPDHPPVPKRPLRVAGTNRPAIPPPATATAPAPVPAPAVPPPNLPPNLPPPLPHQKAASDTDTPSRGLPQATADPGKRITGGFGNAMEAQYFPLDGNELREVIFGLLDEIRTRMRDDLRFSMAATYPRVAATVTIEVTGYAEDQSFHIIKVMPPHTKTPEAIARLRADEICFVVVAEHVEMTPEGESITPPNAARLAHGLPVPQKQAIPTPTGRMIVDIATHRHERED